MPRVTEMSIAPAHYVCGGKICAGSNLTYRVDGKPRSSRVPWVAVNPAVETARIEKLIERTEK